MIYLRQIARTCVCIISFALVSLTATAQSDKDPVGSVVWDATQIGKCLDTLRNPRPYSEEARLRCLKRFGEVVNSYLASNNSTASIKEIIMSSLSPEMVDIYQRFLALTDMEKIRNIVRDRRIVSAELTQLFQKYDEASDIVAHPEKSLPVLSLPNQSPSDYEAQLANWRKQLQDWQDISTQADRHADTAVKNKMNRELQTAITQSKFKSLEALQSYITTLQVYVDDLVAKAVAKVKAAEAKQDILAIYTTLPVASASLDPLSKGALPDDKRQLTLPSGSTVVSLQSVGAAAPIAAAASGSFGSQLIDGVAIYMVRRFKQDAVLIFLRGLKKYADRQPIIKALFKNTLDLLKEDPDFETPRFGQVWSHAIAEDVINLPEGIAESEVIKKIIKNDETTEILRDIIGIATVTRQNLSFPAIVSYVNTNERLHNRDLQFAFGLLQILVEQFHTTNGTRYFLDWQTQFNAMSVRDKTICIGLLMCRYSETFKKFAPGFRSLYNNGNSNEQASFAAGQVHTFLSKLLVRASAFQNEQDRLSDLISQDKKLPEKITDFWQFTQDMLQLCLDNELMPKEGNTKEKIQKLLLIAKKGTDLYQELNRKNYSALVHQALMMIQDLSPKTSVYTSLLVNNWKLVRDGQLEQYKLVEPYLEQIGTILGADNAQYTKDKDQLFTIATAMYVQLKEAHLDHDVLVFDNPNQLIKHIEKLYQIKKGPALTSSKQSDLYQLVKFAGFFTDLLAAKDSKQVADVVASYAAPANSFMIKRQSRFSIDLNSYIGAYFGAEANSLSFLSKSADVKPVYGLSAPIGVTMSWGFTKKPERLDEQTYLNKNGVPRTLRGSAFAVNLQVVDIGAVVAYRIQTGEDGGLPSEFSFAQVLSPGVSLSYAIKNIPASFTLGMAYTPQLRTLTTNTVASGRQQIQTAPIGRQVFRAYIGFFYDLPFKNFYKR